MEKSKIAKLSFEPYLFGPTAVSQGIFYMIQETINKMTCADKFAREILTLPDGGTVAIDWDGSIPDPNKKPDKPILVICPGLGGDSRNLYSTALVRAARLRFKVATILYRGADGIPITTPKLSYFGMWKDIDFVMNHVDTNYVRDSVTKEKLTRLYSYGVSLGGQVLLMYLGKAGKRAKEVLDGASVFSAIWHTKTNSHWFKTHAFGFYNFLVGMTLN